MRENSRWEFLIPSYTIKTSHFDAKTHATFTFHIDLGRVTIFFFLFFLFKVTIKLFNYCKNKKIVKLLIFLVFFFFSPFHEGQRCHSLDLSDGGIIHVPFSASFLTTSNEIECGYRRGLLALHLCYCQKKIIK